MNSKHTKFLPLQVIATVWIISLFIMSPMLMFSKLDYRPLPKFQKCTVVCRLHFSSDEARKVWWVCFYTRLFSSIAGILSKPIT